MITRSVYPSRLHRDDKRSYRRPRMKCGYGKDARTSSDLSRSRNANANVRLKVPDYIANITSLRVDRL